MSRNVNSFFSEVPASLDIGRSKFIRNQSIKTSFNVGDLIPFYVDEVLPGDTYSVDTSKVVRLSTPITPIMDNIWLDTYYFFVPNRLVWEHWKEFMGENTQSAWIPQVQYSVPQMTSPASTGWNVGTIADYMGIPTGIAGLSVNALPLRMYALICNEWFRDENLTDPIYVPVGDATVAGSNGTQYNSDCAKGGAPFKVAKYHDFYSSCLPAPQKGVDVPLPLGASAPVYASGTLNPTPYNKTSIFFATADGTAIGSGNHNIAIYSGNTTNTFGRTTTGANSITGDTYKDVYPANLYTDLTLATGTSINQLRQAFQVQKLYEKDARGGTRYTEILKSHFGVTSPDSRLQRPEYLGGSRIPININQVLQQSETTSSSPLGDTGAYSLTIDSHSDFTKSFTEHGFVIGVCCARYDHTYQQGLEKMWSRTLREHYYFPVFANLGEQAVKNREIYAQGTSVDDQVFGYQECWAEYRYKPNRVSGMMRSSYSQSLDIWHLADDYSSLPSLSDSWIREDKSNVDRVLAVSSSVSHQLIADIYVSNKSVRPMPLYSVPGLIDHH